VRVDYDAAAAAAAAVLLLLVCAVQTRRAWNNCDQNHAAARIAKVTKRKRGKPAGNSAKHKAEHAACALCLMW